MSGDCRTWLGDCRTCPPSIRRTEPAILQVGGSFLLTGATARGFLFLVVLLSLWLSRQLATCLAKLFAGRHPFVTRGLLFFLFAVASFETVAGQDPHLPRDLPGIAGGLGTVGVTDYAGGIGPIDDLEMAAEIIEQIKAGSLLPHSVAQGQFETTDLTDPDTHPVGGPILDQTWPWHFPSDSPADDDDFLSVARGVLRVAEAGTYTLQVRSSEGMGLRLIGTPFTAVYGNGQLDRDGAMIHPFSTNDADSRGVIELAAGLHEFEFLMWERSGAAYWELTSAQGAHVNASTARWLALGDTTELPAVAGPAPIATLVDTALVANLADDDGGAANDIPTARALILNALENGQGFVRDDVTTIVLHDHDGICCLRPGKWVRGAGRASRWPLNDPDFGGDLESDADFFSSGLFGQLRVDDGDQLPGETHWLTFGLFASDGAQLQIRGAGFADSNQNGALSHELDGDTVLTFPEWRTGNTNTLGLISLREGVDYDWEGFHYEHRVDAGYEIWVAQGNQLEVDYTNVEEFFSVFAPLSSAGDILSIPRNTGLALALRGDYDDDGQLGAGDLDLQTRRNPLRRARSHL